MKMSTFYTSYSSMVISLSCSLHSMLYVVVTNQTNHVLVSYRYKKSKNTWTSGKKYCNYAPNFEEVDWAYWFRVVLPCVRPSIRQEACMLGFEISCMDSSWKNSRQSDTFFLSCPSYLPFWSYTPLKKSEWSLMLAISYEPCMLGF